MAISKEKLKLAINTGKMEVKIKISKSQNHKEQKIQGSCNFFNSSYPFQRKQLVHLYQSPKDVLCF